MHTWQCGGCGPLAQRSGKKLGVMFLVEAALGKAHEIAADDHTLTKPPKGAPLSL